jgi:hypothetical protein
LLVCFEISKGPLHGKSFEIACYPFHVSLLSLTEGYRFNPGLAVLLGVPNMGGIGVLAAVNTSLSVAAGAMSGLFANIYLEEIVST